MAETDRRQNSPEAAPGDSDPPKGSGPDPRDIAPGPVRYWRWSLVGFAILIAIVALLSLT